MIEAIRFYTNHTVLGIVIEGVPALYKSVYDIADIVKPIFVKVLITIPLFLLHHNIFAFGFVIGFILHKDVSTIVEKVNIVYNTRRSMLENVMLFGGGGFIACLTMPTSMIIATLYYSAQWGAELYQNSSARYVEQMKKETPAPVVDAPKEPAEKAVDPLSGG